VRRYDNEHIRATVSVILLLGDVLLFLPIRLYMSSVLIRSIAVVSAVANC
jgi:hypothetical protein